MSHHDLERLEKNVAAELAMVESAHPDDPSVSFMTFDPTDPFAIDPTDVMQYEVELRGLRNAVVGMERWEDGLGST